MLQGTNYTLGIKVEDTTDVKSKIQKIYQDALPETSVEDGTPIGMLINIDTANMLEQQELLGFGISQYSTSSARGDFLDTLFSNDGIARINNTYSIATITFTGTAGSIIRAGTILKSTYNDEFTTLTQAIVSLSGTVDVQVRSVVVGAIPVLKDTINILQSAVPNITSVNNANDGLTGTERETDPLYRIRGRRQNFRNGTGGLQNIISRISEVVGVLDVQVVENNTKIDKTIDVKTVIGNSIRAVVLGGDNTDIANALQGSKSIGCAYNGDVSVILDISGVMAEVKFDRPTEQAMQVRVTLDANQAVIISPEQVTDAVVAYFTDNMQIGSDLSPADLTGYLYDNLQGIRLSAVQASIQGGTLTFEPTVVPFFGLATIDIADIVVGG